MPVYGDTLHWSDITQIFETITELDLILEFDFYLIAWDFLRTFDSDAACH